MIHVLYESCLTVLTAGTPPAKLHQLSRCFTSAVVTLTYDSSSSLQLNVSHALDDALRECVVPDGYDGSVP